jgi:hypothetical protein
MSSQRIQSLAKITPAEEVYFNVVRSLRRIEKDLRESLPQTPDARLAAEYLDALVSCQQHVKQMEGALACLKQSRSV